VNLHITNHQYGFERRLDDKRIVVMLNASENNYAFEFNFNASEVFLLFNLQSLLKY